MTRDYIISELQAQQFLINEVYRQEQEVVLAKEEEKAARQTDTEKAARQKRVDAEKVAKQK